MRSAGLDFMVVWFHTAAGFISQTVWPGYRSFPATGAHEESAYEGYGNEEKGENFHTVRASHDGYLLNEK